MKTTIVTENREQTQAFAAFLAQKLKGGELIFLEGPLGVGKTTFTQGFAKGLKIEDNVNSPTFVLMKLYEGDHTLVHIDAYRLEGVDQELGFEDYIDGENIVIIEWAHYIKHLLEKPDIVIEMNYFNKSRRQLHINACEPLIKEIEAYEN